MADPQPLSVGLSLSQPPPTLLLPGIEVAQPGYARMLLQFQQPSDATGVLVNTATIEWPRAVTPWGRIGWLIAFSPIDGSYLGFGPVVSELTDAPTVVLIDRGDVARFRAAGIVLTPSDSLYGLGSYGVGPYSAGIGISGIIEAAFADAGPCAGAPGWVLEALPQ
jgi:hypothetical protein